MVEAGVSVRRFHEPAWYDLDKLNNRTHRKVLVVDGEIGFTGGVGIADVWSGHAQDPTTGATRTSGPRARWSRKCRRYSWTTGSRSPARCCTAPDYFPALEKRGDAAGQMFSSSPEGGSESMHLMYLLAITAAGEVDPPVERLFRARRPHARCAPRGGEARRARPDHHAGEHMDAETVRKASRAQWGDLLEAGIEISEYQPTMYHCKVLVVDGIWVSVGSTNFDNRSFSLTTRRISISSMPPSPPGRVAVFEQDRAHSTPITLAAWKERPLPEKMLEHTASLLRLQL
jgi:cardiolipin synthase